MSDDDIRTDERRFPEVGEYPGLGRITAQAPTASQTGEQPWFVHDVPNPRR